MTALLRMNTNINTGGDRITLGMLRTGGDMLGETVRILLNNLSGKILKMWQNPEVVIFWKRDNKDKSDLGKAPGREENILSEIIKY